MTDPRVYFSHLYLTILCFIVNKRVENLKITIRKILCHHSVKKKKKIFTSSKSFWKPFSQLLHYSSMMNILIYREFVWAFNNNHANNNEVFFSSVAAAALMERLPLAASYVMVTVITVARASWTQRQMYLCVCEYFITLWAFMMWL